jgi:hypothetical protein
MCLTCAASELAAVEQCARRSRRQAALGGARAARVEPLDARARSEATRSAVRSAVS